MSRQAPSAQAPELPGLTFVERVGAGGYADVFLYEQQMPRMPVAVKMLKGEGLTEPLRAQFRAEADTMARLSDHPYIVQVFGAGTSSDGRPYLVMKYYPPPNLAMRAREGRFSVEETLRTGIQLASAVETAHRAGITHRDIKPANVLITQYNTPGLTDFGIAGRGLRAGEQAESPEAADTMGVSVPWAAPEVLFGHSNGDESADIYSLAATLWQLLVGRSPFEVPGGDNSAYGLMPRIRKDKAPSTGRADVPVALDRLLQQAMAKESSVRPRSALALARALQQIEQEQRFSRTPIVVLDEQGHTTFDAGSSRSAATVDTDATRVRAPQAVYGQLSAPAPMPSAFETPAHPGARQAAASMKLGAGLGMAVPRYDTPGSGTAPQDATIQRPPTLPTPPAASPNHPTSVSPAALATLAVVVILAAALSVVFLWHPAGRPTQPSPTAIGTSSISQNPDVLNGNTPQTPVPAAVPSKGEVLFRWSYPSPQPGDYFRIVLGHSDDQLNEIEAKGHFRQVDVPHYAVLKLKKGTTWCLRVRMIRGGVQSPWSDSVCDRAG